MLVLTLGALAISAVLSAALLLPHACMLERACAASVLMPAMAIGLVYALGAISLITPLAWAVATLLVFVISMALLAPRARATLEADARTLRAAAGSIAGSAGSIACVVVALVSVSLAVLAAGWLEPWAWDALGYHLPIVHDALQSRALRVVPTHVVYINCYPRLVDVFFVAWRLGLSDETWIELGQLPFTITGVTSIAAIAHRAGVPIGRALAGASLWLATPVVMLQLAAAYVDVAVASLCLASFALVTAPRRDGDRLELVAGLAIGLLLGSKPSAPPIAAVAILALLVRAAREGRLAHGALGGALALLVGGWKYAENLVTYGDPIWPVTLALGPLRFEGRVEMAELTLSNLPEPYRSMGWLHRVVASWTAQPSRWVFDMRIGGFGPLFTFGLLPAAVIVAIAAWRSRPLRAAISPVAAPVGLAIFATLATPGAYWSRYTLAVPGALVALSLAAGNQLSPRGRTAGEIGAVLLAVAGIVLSWRGLTEGGPSLFEIGALPPEARVSAYAIDAQEPEWRAARMRVGPDEAFGYDSCFGLPGRLVRRDGRGRVSYFEAGGPGARPSRDELEAWIARERVRVVALQWGPGQNAEMARSEPDRFRELFVSDYPDWQPCVIFEVIERAP